MYNINKYTNNETGRGDSIMKKFWMFEIASLGYFILYCVAAIMNNRRGVVALVLTAACTVIAMRSLDITRFKKVIFVILQLLGYFILWVIFLMILLAE